MAAIVFSIVFLILFFPQPLETIQILDSVIEMFDRKLSETLSPYINPGTDVAVFGHARLGYTAHADVALPNMVRQRG
jgi:hypothetical protein